MQQLCRALYQISQPLQYAESPDSQQKQQRRYCAQECKAAAVKDHLE